MSFNFGQSGYNYANTNGVDAIAPENTGISGLAQQRLNNIVGRASQRLINALNVDGVPLTIWIKTQTGFPCTCCRPDGESAGLLSSSVKDLPSTNNFYTDLESTDLPDVNEQKYKIIRMKGADLVNDISNPQWSELLNNNPKITPEITENISINSVQVDLNQDEDFDIVVSDANEQEGYQSYGNLELDDFFSGGDSGAVFGGDKTACGICFTSGWTQGYSLINGKRIVLDSSGEVPFSLQGAELISNTFPHSFNLPVNNTGVYWKIELPVFCQQWINLRARNNLSPTVGILIEYCNNDGNFNWQTLTLDVLNSTSNTSTRVWLIRARRDPSYNSMSKVTFTHLELMVITSNPVPSQTPNFSYNTDFNQYDAIVNTQFDIAPTISMLPRESVFSDNKYGLFWKVIDVSPQMTSAQQIFGYSVTARLVQRHEQLYKLHELYTQVPAYLSQAGITDTTYQNYNSTVPRQLNEIASTATSFEGLEKVQGGYSPVNLEEQGYGQQVDNIQLDDAQPLLFNSVESTAQVIALQSNLGAVLKDDLTGSLLYEGTQPNPIVIRSFPSIAIIDSLINVTGTLYPANLIVQIGYTQDLNTPPTFWQDATVNGYNWSSNIIIQSLGQFYILARVYSSNIYNAAVGPISIVN